MKTILSVLSITLFGALSIADAQEKNFNIELYSDNCAACHGNTGNGEGSVADLRRKPENFCESVKTEQEKFSILNNGGKKRDGTPGTMPSWGNALSQGQINGLLDYIKNNLCAAK